LKGAHVEPIGNGEAFLDPTANRSQIGRRIITIEHAGTQSTHDEQPFPNSIDPRIDRSTHDEQAFPNSIDRSTDGEQASDPRFDRSIDRPTDNEQASDPRSDRSID
jgi:hypothetical protein